MGDKDTFIKLQSALDSLKEVADTQEEKLNDDPSAAIKQLNAKLNKLIKGLKAHRGRFNRIENRISGIEQNGIVGGGGGGNANKGYEAAIGLSTSVDIGGGVKPIKKKKQRRKL